MLTTDKIHVFEKAGLGAAPYRLIGIEENVFVACPGATPRAGGSCDYCSTGIRFEYWLEAADGKTFKVGCDCIRKSGDSGLTDVVEKADKKLKKELKHKRDVAVIEAAKTVLPFCRGTISEQPHPHDGLAKEGKTLLDWVRFMFEKAGTSGQLGAARVVQNFYKKSLPVS